MQLFLCLRSIHWPKAWCSRRIRTFVRYQSCEHELAVLVHRALHGIAPYTCLTFFAALLTCRLVVVYGRRLPVNLMSARRVSQLSETVRLPLLGQSSGTVSLMTLHRPHRCQFSERNWKLTYFINLTRTLFCSLLWFFVAIVVFEVNCYLGHVKICNVM